VLGVISMSGNTKRGGNDNLIQKKLLSDLRDFTFTWSTLLALIVICFVFALRSPEFFSLYNLIDILIQVAPLGIIAAGLTVCVLGGEFDVSMSSVLTLAGVSAAMMMKNEHSASIAFLAALGVGVIVGSTNASMVVYLKVPSLIATLATVVVIDGLSLLYSGGYRVYRGMKPEFLFMGTGRLIGIPMPIVILVVWSLVVWIVLSKTIWGKRIYAVGVNPEAARLSGVNYAAHKFAGMLFCSIAAAIAAMVVVARVGAAEPFSRFAYVLDAFAAVFLGATVRLEGRPHMLGTAVGVLALGVLNNGLTMFGTSFFMQNILKGVLILLAVAGSVAIQLRRE